MTKAIMESYYC